MTLFFGTATRAAAIEDQFCDGKIPSVPFRPAADTSTTHVVRPHACNVKIVEKLILDTRDTADVSCGKLVFEKKKTRDFLPE